MTPEAARHSRCIAGLLSVDRSLGLRHLYMGLVFQPALSRWGLGVFVILAKVWDW